MRENLLTVTAARLAAIPFLLRRRRAFTAPRKVLILKTCCLSQVMLTTPLLAVLSTAYPDARFDWAISDWARPAIAGNPRITELLNSGGVGLGGGWGAVRRLVAQLRAEAYDTCIIPSRSSLLALIAWRAGIPQRIGLNVGGRGFAHTVPVRPTAGLQHEAEVYLGLARALHIDPQLIARAGRMEFYPPDRDRTAVTAQLVEEVDWLGDEPLVVMHPGGGQNPLADETIKQWPAERFALLANHVVRRHGARVVLVGSAADRARAEAVLGMMSVPGVNLAGQLNLGELGALCELADLYVGNDAGPTHVAAAVGCPTLAVFGPSAPAVSGPYRARGEVRAVWRERGLAPFDWAEGVTVEETAVVVDGLLAGRRG